MPRPKSERHSTDLDAEIARLEQERKRLIQSEDQRRGAIVRACLGGPDGSQLRNVLRPLVNSRDAFLFGLESPAVNLDKPSDLAPKTARRRASETPQPLMADGR